MSKAEKLQLKNNNSNVSITLSDLKPQVYSAQVRLITVFPQIDNATQGFTQRGRGGVSGRVGPGIFYPQKKFPHHRNLIFFKNNLHQNSSLFFFPKISITSRKLISGAQKTQT